MKKLLKKTFLYKIYLRNKIKRIDKSSYETALKIRGPIMDKFLPKNSIGVELGVLKGHFSSVLLETTMPKELHLIDPFYFLDAEWHWSEGNLSTIDAVCNILQKNKKRIEEKQVFLHIQDDRIVLKSFSDAYFDWAYLDSSHEYFHTKDELNLLHTKVKPDGIIAGDDWVSDPSHKHHGVYKAVNEFIIEFNYDLIYASDENKQWFIKRK